MGFYLRKSLRFGPLRLNLSSSGVGASVGFKGFRIGAGPRGNYIHAGRGGLYYRRTLSSNERAEALSPQSSQQHACPSRINREPATIIDSGSSIELVDETSADLINEIGTKTRRWRLWPFAALLFSVLLVWQLFDGEKQGVLSATGAAAVVSIAVVMWWDRNRKTTVVFYDLDAEFAKAYEELYYAIEAVKQCARTWTISSAADVYDSKYHAGADQLLEREETRISEKGLAGIKTNLSVFSIGAGTQVLAFLPDRLLVFDSAGVGAVDYRNLHVEVRDSKFIESGPLPKDSTVIDYTWQFTNKNGGPDKRFVNNRQLPIVLYEECIFGSRSGLHEAFQSSQKGAWSRVQKAVQNLVALMPVQRVDSVDYGSIAAARIRRRSKVRWLAVPVGAAIVALAVAKMRPEILRSYDNASRLLSDSFREPDHVTAKTRTNAPGVTATVPQPATNRSELTEQRTWTDAKGRTLEAKLLSVEKDNGGLFLGKFKRPTGEEFTYHIGLLSRDDVAVVKNAMKAKGIPY